MKLSNLKKETICSLFEKQVALTPLLPATIFNTDTLNYSELNIKSNQLALYLTELGIFSGDIIAINIDRSIDLPIIILAILKVGAAYLPLDTDSPQLRLQNILSNSKPKLLIANEFYLKKFSDYSGTIKSLEDILQKSQFLKGEFKSKATPNSLAYLIYTSGSTGEPKGVESIHIGLTNRLVWMQKEYKINFKDRILHKTPLSFDVSVWEILLPLICGATLIISPPSVHKDPIKIINLIEKYSVTALHFVPIMLGVFLDFIEHQRCKSLKNVFASGEALTEPIVEKFFKKLNSRLHNLYGPTEASIDVTYYECRPNYKVTIGKPISNTKIYILTDNLLLCDEGEIGEIYISSIGLAKGYLNRPDLTAERFIDNPFIEKTNKKMSTFFKLYKTGDLGKFLSDGNIHYIGRVDHQVKIHGHRVELGEIESMLQKSPYIKEAAVITKINNTNNQILIAAIVPLNLSENNENDFLELIKQYMRNNLPEYMIPANYIILNELPITTSGKIDRVKLGKLDAKVYKKNSFSELPQTAIESKICEICSSVLEVENMTLSDNFFDLGGNSILAMKLLLRLKKEFKPNIPLRVIFEANNIKELCGLIESK